VICYAPPDRPLDSYDHLPFLPPTTVRGGGLGFRAVQPKVDRTKCSLEGTWRNNGGSERISNGLQRTRTMTLTEFLVLTNTTPIANNLQRPNCGARSRVQRCRPLRQHRPMFIFYFLNSISIPVGTNHLYMRMDQRGRWVYMLTMNLVCWVLWQFILFAGFIPQVQNSNIPAGCPTPPPTTATATTATTATRIPTGARRVPACV
jgi:hypothetical protein